MHDLQMKEKIDTAAQFHEAGCCLELRGPSPRFITAAPTAPVQFEHVRLKDVASGTDPVWPGMYDLPVSRRLPPHIPDCFGVIRFHALPELWNNCRGSDESQANGTEGKGAGPFGAGYETHSTSYTPVLLYCRYEIEVRRDEGVISDTS